MDCECSLKCCHVNKSKLYLVLHTFSFYSVPFILLSPSSIELSKDSWQILSSDKMLISGVNQMYTAWLREADKKVPLLVVFSDFLLVEMN